MSLIIHKNKTDQQSDFTFIRVVTAGRILRYSPSKLLEIFYTILSADQQFSALHFKIVIS